MPVQRTLFGRPVRPRMPPRRFQLLGTFVLLAFISLFVFGPPTSTSIPTYDQVKDAVEDVHIPKMADFNVHSLPNPWGQATHKPPVQANSTASSSSSYRLIEWFSDFKWRNAFSQSVTLDENRAVLPPLTERPPIYTYYDPKGKLDKSIAEAENKLLLAWRRAWWAQGFRPQVLSRAEAMKHPQYVVAQRWKVDRNVELELMRWLAWGHMGGGIMANWLALPMAEQSNPMLEFLRRNEYPVLSRVDTLHNGVFFGEGAAVNAAIKKAFRHELLQNVTANEDKITELPSVEGGAMVALLEKDDVAVDPKANGIAYYSSTIISTKYDTVAKKLTNETHVEGLSLLASLINSHLHLTFQETYPDGITILTPLPAHTTALLDPAIDIARNLTQCPTTPMPKSCPPNRLKCKPCDAAKPRPLLLEQSYKDTATSFTIGTVPHPYTLTSLHYSRDTLDANFVRKDTARDIWLGALTQSSLGGAAHTDEFRTLAFKDAVAGTDTGIYDSSSSSSASSHPLTKHKGASANTNNAHPYRTLWLTAEHLTMQDLDYTFGFILPSASSSSFSSSSPPSPADSKGTPSTLTSHLLTIFPRPAPPSPLPTIPTPDAATLEAEHARLRSARALLRSKKEEDRQVVERLEAWNMGDMEAWRFARAWGARRRMERKRWEEEEGGFAGSEASAGVFRVGGGGGGRGGKKAGGAGRWSD